VIGAGKVPVYAATRRAEIDAAGETAEVGAGTFASI